MMSQLEACDLCDDHHPLRKVHLHGFQFFCLKFSAATKVASRGTIRKRYCLDGQSGCQIYIAEDIE